MSDTVAAQQLRAFLERIERLQEERKTIGDDIAEVFKELEDVGFDKFAAKIVLKIRAAGIEEYRERTAQIDLYLSALGMLPAPAGARTREIIPPSGNVVAHVVAAVSASPPASSGADEMEAPFEPPAFLRQDKPLRPHCRKPDDCAGYGKTHCHVCLKATGEMEAA